MAHVSELNCYPIKSCAGTRLDTASFTPQGVAFDSEWMVANEAGTFMSQRTHPQLALVLPRLTDRHLLVTAPGMEELAVDLSGLDNKSVSSTVWGNDAPAISQGDDANGWFSDYLHTSAQLVRRDPKGTRQIKSVYRAADVTDQVSFADGAPILLATMPSLRALNKQLETPIPMDRFRPNIVIDGEDIRDFDEDYWRCLKIGKLVGVIGWACARCIIPEIDQATGVRGKQVLKALQGFRKGVDAIDQSNKGVFFGQNLLHTPEPGVTVSVGDTVHVTNRSAARNILGLID